MNKFIFSLILFCIGIGQINSQNAEQEVNETKHSIQSKILNEERVYEVSLPDSYFSDKASQKKYPVLVLLDGNRFFKSISGMVNYMSSDTYRSWKIPEMIVIAIHNVDRRRDYTPDKIITVRKNNSGGGENFLNFLEKELLPEIDSKYRTTSERILFGHSLGGLLATHAYMKENSSFKSFLAIDPSFGTWNTETMDKKLNAMTENSFTRYIYIASANWGKRNINNRDRHVRFYESLNAKCKGKLPAKLEYFENESHSSVPLIAFYNGITTIFEGYNINR